MPVEDIVEDKCLGSELFRMQDVTRQRRSGVYRLEEDWLVYSHFSRHCEGKLVSGFLQLIVEMGSLVVVSRDNHRKRGLPYRVRVKSATIHQIGLMTGANHFQWCTEDEVFDFRVGSTIECHLNLDARKINGSGVYVSPSLNECRRLMDFDAMHESTDDKAESAPEEDDDDDETDNDTKDGAVHPDQGPVEDDAIIELSMPSLVRCASEVTSDHKAALLAPMKLVL